MKSITKQIVSNKAFDYSKAISKSLKLIFLLVSIFSFAQAIDKGNYFIAISHDGNSHDEDDILSAGMSIAMLTELGLWNKVLHYEYNNNLGGEKPGSVAAMRETVNGALDKWGADKSKVFDLQTLTMNVSEAAKSNFKKAAQTAFDKGAILYYACGGPMEAPYQMVSSLPVELRKVVHVLGHGIWNQGFKRHSSSRNWTDLIKITGNYKLIDNQNASYFNEPNTDWKWLNDKGGRYSWLYSRNQKSPDFDSSDSGLVYYIITGRGNQKSSKEEIIKIFSGQSLGVESPRISPEIKIYPNPVSSFLNIDFDDSMSAKEIKIFNIRGQLVYSNKTKDTTVKIDFKDLKIKEFAIVRISINGKTIKRKIQLR